MNWDLLNKAISSLRIGVISVQTVILLLLFAGVLLGFFFVLRKYVVPFLGSRKRKRRMLLLLYRAEVISWLIYVVLGLYRLLEDSLFITSIILIVLILAGRNIWKDLFSGIVFRLENNFSIGDPVRFDTYNGTLEEINRRNIRIKSDKEELVTIPFRKLNNTIFIKRQAKGKLHSEQLNLHVGNRSTEEAIPLIQQWLYECPWAVVNENSTVRVIGGGLLQLTVYAIDVDSIQKIEEFLQQQLRK